MKKTITISKLSPCGIWENQESVARIFEDKILLDYPKVCWRGNTGSLVRKRIRITNQDVIARVRSFLSGGCEAQAWELIEG